MKQMTEQEYRAAEGINKSTMWEVRKSPAHYQHVLKHPPAETEALRVGRAIHSAILTKKCFAMEYAEMPDWDARTKAGRAARDQWLAELPDGVTALSRADLLEVYAARKAFRQSKEARALIKGARRERPIFWTDEKTGLLCKCRVDAMTSSAAVDIKTTTDGSAKAFLRDAIKYGYHVQAAHYLDGIEAALGKRPDWYFIVIEKAEPHGVHIFKASDDFLEYGAFVRDQLMETIRACMESGEWPGYHMDELHAPSWAMMGDD